jgi:hypothetical protein
LKLGRNLLKFGNAVCGNYPISHHALNSRSGEYFEFQISLLAPKEMISSIFIQKSFLKNNNEKYSSNIGEGQGLKTLFHMTREL